MTYTDGMSTTAGNWVELQNKLDWLSQGVVYKSLTLSQYITGVRELMDSYEFMVNPHGN